jgi:UDP-glucuronate 4-epimerase
LDRILVTGAAGMIGYHLLARLIAAGHDCTGCDSFTPYYDVRLKKARARQLRERFGFEIETLDICDAGALDALFQAKRPDVVVNLAAQPGVRQGLEDSRPYVNSNLVGFSNILDACRRRPPRHLLYASSSSVYGANTNFPWSESQPTELPVSLYAATKKSNELLAHSYSHLTGIPMTGLRYFTVFGEWGRPDMAPYKFASHIVEGLEITLYNHGQMTRDFTFIDDAIEATVRLIAAIPSSDAVVRDGISPVAPHRVVNIGSGRPVVLGDFVRLIEREVGKPARIRYAERVGGDVVDTFADTSRLRRLTGFVPATSIDVGVSRLVGWLRTYSSADPA